jgi:predicted metal-dependent phosphoesterase TrpH
MSRSRRRRSRVSVCTPSDTRRVDLHMHSNLSDGKLSPQEILDQAINRKLDIICISDHDLAPSIAAQSYHKNDHSVRVIHGAEMSVDLLGEEQHFLAYFPEQMPEEFRSVCHKAVQARAVRYEQLRLELGFEGVRPCDEAAKSGERSLTRLHLARAVVDAGHARSISEVFTRWLRHKEGVEHFPKAIEMIQLIKAHGGVCIWAHPSLKKASLHSQRLKKEGLDGLEVFRPYSKKGDKKRLRMLCKTHGLLRSGGSDSHDDSMGLFSFPAEEIHNWPASFSFQSP